MPQLSIVTLERSFFEILKSEKIAGKDAVLRPGRCVQVYGAGGGGRVYEG